MRSMITKRGMAATLGLLAIGTGAWAAPAIEGWTRHETASQERLRVQWTEPVPVQVDRFPSARKVIVTIPTASLGHAGLPVLAPGDASLITSAQAASVVLPSGRDGVQVHLTLSEWAEPTVLTGPGALTVTFDRPADMPPPASARVVSLTNDDIEEYGSSAAPPEGAGQAQMTASDVENLFYIPEALTEEQRGRGVNEELGMLQTMEIFNRYVDLDFKNAQLQDIIRTMAAKLGLNIVIQPALVRGTVTVSLKNVRLGDAMDVLLKANGLAYKIEQGGIVRIVDRREVRTSDIETVVQSVSINWVDAASVAQVVSPFLSDRVGQVQAAVESNLLIIEDVPEKVTQIQRLIERVDVPEKQVRMEVRLVDMTEEARRNLGFTWSLTSKSVEDVVDRSNPGELVPAIERSFGTVSSAEPSFFFLNNIEDVSLFGTEYALESRLQAEEGRREAITLANPTILSLNNTPASIEIQRQIPYIDGEVDTNGGVRRVNFQNVGTKVELTPLITNNGYVKMTIQPEQIILVGETEGIPITDQRSAETSVIVRDEQTVALGGLRQFAATTDESGIPWLLRAPVVSWLFKTQNNRQDRLELYLFVTPHIIKDPEPTTYEMGMYEKIDYNWDLPDYYFDEVTPRKGPKELVDPRLRRAEPFTISQ